MIVLFYICCYLIKVLFVYLAYHQLTKAFDLPNLNFWQILMILTFLLILKLAVSSSDYADMKAYKEFTTIEKLGSAYMGVLITAFLAFFCFLLNFLV